MQENNDLKNSDPNDYHNSDPNDLNNSDPMELKLSEMMNSEKFDPKSIAKLILNAGEKFPKLKHNKLISEMTRREKVVHAMRYIVEKWIDTGKPKIIVREPRMVADLRPFIETILRRDTVDGYDIFKQAVDCVLKMRPNGIYLGACGSDVVTSTIWFVGLATIWSILTEENTS